ncbi:Protein of unknown function [Gryllus bimaculatus]|nr:Protein of unknown function [Gryllus bimaculatus]
MRRLGRGGAAGAGRRDATAAMGAGAALVGAGPRLHLGARAMRRWIAGLPRGALLCCSARDSDSESTGSEDYSSDLSQLSREESEIRTSLGKDASTPRSFTRTNLLKCRNSDSFVADEVIYAGDYKDAKLYIVFAEVHHLPPATGSRDVIAYPFASSAPVSLISAHPPRPRYFPCCPARECHCVIFLKLMENLFFDIIMDQRELCSLHITTVGKLIADVLNLWIQVQENKYRRSMALIPLSNRCDAWLSLIE